MAVCPSCGTENPVDAKLCGKCGAGMSQEQATAQPSGPSTTEARPSETGEGIAEDIGDLGKRIGDAIGKDALGWWDRTFGMFGPVVAGILAAFGFLVLVLIVGAIEASADEPEFWDDLGDFLVKYAWLFVVWGFVSAFQNYFNRNYRKTFRWISPVVSAFGFTIFFWALANIMLFAGARFEHSDLVSQSNFLEGILPVIFVLVAIVGYALAFVQWNAEKTARKSP